MALCQERHPITDQLCAMPESKHITGDHYTVNNRRWRTDHTNPAWEAMLDSSAVRRVAGDPDLHIRAWNAIQLVLSQCDDWLDSSVRVTLLETANFHWHICEKLGVTMPNPFTE